MHSNFQNNTVVLQYTFKYFPPLNYSTTTNNSTSKPTYSSKKVQKVRQISQFINNKQTYLML